MATPTSRRHVPRAARGPRSTTANKRHVSALLGNAAFLLLGMAALALITALVVASQHIPASSAAGAGGSSSAGPQASNAQVATSDWIPLRSSAPADILAAARKSSLFQQNLAGSGDHISDLSRLGAPVYVQAIQPAGAAVGQYPDFYVVPILNTSGATTDAAELELNSSHTAIQVIAIVTYGQPHPHGSIARLPASAAVAAVSGQQHSAVRPGTAPQLAYFPADAAAQETGQITWTGGGEFPADPIWLVHGTDGRDHLVGVDGRTYYPGQLPMIKAGS